LNLSKSLKHADMTASHIMAGNNVPAPLAHGHPVMGVTELLENVLINLKPGDTLYNAQAVCRFWKEASIRSTMWLGYH
jgi:hypothetical protein